MKTAYSDEAVRLYQGDVLAWALDYKKQIDAGDALPFMAVISDPPYGLGDPPPIDELLKHWLDNKDYNTGVGFMSSRWDCVVHPKYWRALLDIVYPGGYLFAFSGTRTADLLGISCRLGGWEPFDRVTNFVWNYASGFPKSHNTSKALDASEIVPCPDCDGKGTILPNMPRESMQAWADNQGVTFDEAMLVLSDQCETCDGSGQVVGMKREVVGRYRSPENTTGMSSKDDSYGFGMGDMDKRFITAPATPLAQAFDGYGSALKPAGEPILLFRKPRAGRTFAQCAREFGSGGLNIGETRVGNETITVKQVIPNIDMFHNYSGDKCQAKGIITQHTGRWPPNVHYSHTPPDTICPTCNGAGCDEQGAPCDECHGIGMTGGCVRVGSKRVRSPGSAEKHNRASIGYGGSDVEFVSKGHCDADGREEVADFACVDGCAVKALDEMAGERPSSGRHGESGSGEKRGLFSMKSTRQRTYFDSGNCSRFYPNHDWSLEIAERLAGETPFRYCAKAGNSERNFGLSKFLPRTRNARKRRHQDLDGSWLARAKCGHPTIKPLSLLIWLCKLAKPPDMFNPRICIPFAGALSETIAAKLAGWKNITAIERERVYCEWGVARWKGMSKWATITSETDPSKIRKKAQSIQEKEAETQKTGQLSFL